MTAATVATTPLTAAEIQNLASHWYKMLDVHAPLAEVLALLADDRLEMRFPEATLRGREDFKNWYAGVTGLFFDEVHTLKSVVPSISGNGARVEVVVRWEASTWQPPAARSERIVLDAYQTWEVVRSTETGAPVIQTYVVDRLAYAPGSARL